MSSILGGFERERLELVEVEGDRAVRREVAAVWRLPLVVLLGENRAEGSEDRVVVGDHADDARLRVISSFSILAREIDRPRGCRQALS